MAPRFQLHARWVSDPVRPLLMRPLTSPDLPTVRSKFRNVESRVQDRAHSFDQLQVAPDAGPALAQPLAASAARVAFAHALDAGGAVRVKRLAAVGKEPAATVRVLLSVRCARGSPD